MNATTDQAISRQDLRAPFSLNNKTRVYVTAKWQGLQAHRHEPCQKSTSRLSLNGRVWFAAFMELITKFGGMVAISISEAARCTILQNCLTPDRKERVGLLAGCGERVEQAFPLANHAPHDDAFFILEAEINRLLNNSNEASVYSHSTLLQTSGMNHQIMFHFRAASFTRKRL